VAVQNPHDCARAATSSCTTRRRPHPAPHDRTHLIEAACCNAVGDPHEIRIDSFSTPARCRTRSVCGQNVPPDGPGSIRTFSAT
jgi:hypothetical protein